jgi:hypothetical protein
MSEAVFVIRNQHGQFWTRSSEWVDGREPQRLLKLKHHDEAINQLVELSSKDIDLRGEVISCNLSARGEPEVEVSEHLTPTLAEKAAAQAELRRAAEAEAAQAECEDSDATNEESVTSVEEPPLSAAV